MPVRNKTRSKAIMWGTQVPLGYFKLIPGIIEKTGDSFVKQLAKSSVKEIKTKIVNQQFKHQKLNPNYLQWKKRKGYDTRILIRKRFFLENIISEKQSGKGIVYRVGVKDVAYTDGKKLVQIASYLEYGTSRMPARPVFRPTYQGISAKSHTYVLTLVAELNKNLKSKLPYVSLSKLKSFVPKR